MLFLGTHVKDIKVQSARDSGPSDSVPESVKEKILSELLDTSQTLQETIRICTEKKLKIDKLIQQLQDEQEDDADKVKAEEEEVEATAAEDVEEEDSVEGGSDEEEEDENDDEDSATETD